MKFKFLVFLTVICLCCLFYKQHKQITVSQKDIFVSRLVYLRGKGLFTGRLEMSDDASTSYRYFCKGVPCGEYAEQQKGGSFVSRGRYIDINSLFNIKQILLNDTVTVNYWQEGGDISSDPKHITICILKSNKFFESKLWKSGGEKLLLNALLVDAKYLKFNFVSIEVVNKIYLPNKYYTVEYQIKDGQWQKISEDISGI